jgi:hypothetical protein
MLFVACRDAALAKDLAAADPTKVVRSMNLEVVSSARKFVWGVDDSQLCFVRNRMSTAPEKQIISDEQKQQGPFRSACHEAVAAGSAGSAVVRRTVLPLRSRKYGAGHINCRRLGSEFQLLVSLPFLR